MRQSSTSALIRFLSGLLCLLLALPGCCLASAAEYSASRPDILQSEFLSGTSCVLIERKNNTVLFSKNADAAMAPASTTKMVTLILALMHGSLKDQVLVSGNALNIPEDAASLNLQPGESIILEDLLYGMMLKSANDAAIAVAEYVSGSVQAFVDLMNAYVQQLGCTGTHFTNPNGLDEENHVSTAMDLALIASACMENEDFARIVKTTDYTIPATNTSRARNITNTNALIKSESGSESYYAYANGIKTGSTSQAGYCMVGSASKENVDLIAVTLKTTGKGRWNDVIRMMDYGFTQYISMTPGQILEQNPLTVDVSGFSATDPSLGKLRLTLRLVSPRESYITGSKVEMDNLIRNFRQELVITYTRAFSAPIQAGEVMGTALYFPDDGSDAISYELVAARSVAARENLPLTLQQIQDYTQADPNPLPRFSPEFVILPLLIAIPLILLIRLLRRLHKRTKTDKSKLPKSKKRFYQ